MPERDFGRINVHWLWVVVPVIVLSLAAAAWREVGSARRAARRASCRKTMRSIGLACHMYADDCDECFPASLEALTPDYIDNPRIFDCCSARAGGLPQPHYLYVPGLRLTHMHDDILMYEPPENHGRRGFHVLFVDAHVEWWPAGRAGEFGVKLARQRRAMRKWQAAGAKPDDIPRFFGRHRNPESKP